MNLSAWELLQLNLNFYTSVMARAEVELAALRLEVKGFFLLAAIEQCKYPAELAKHCLLPKPTVTFMIKRLEKAGLVKRNMVAGDLRKFAITLTPAGRTAIARGQEVLARAVDASLTPLTAKEKAAYAGLMKKLCAIPK